jgi:hypothetical protein
MIIVHPEIKDFRMELSVTPGRDNQRNRFDFYIFLAESLRLTADRPDTERTSSG